MKTLGDPPPGKVFSFPCSPPSPASSERRAAPPGKKTRIRLRLNKKQAG